LSNFCKFSRKCQKDKGFEYGVIEIENVATKNEKRHCKVLGKASTMQEALAKNEMSLEGAPKIRPNVLPHFWD
jgi:hypothetical protein